MPIRIYNSLSRTKEPLEPLNPPQVNIYTCGVTVYDKCHIGHARSLYIFDVIRRYLEYKKFQVNFVRNITDIDDKIINRANELKADWKDLVEKYIKGYYEDLESLGIRKGIIDEDDQEEREPRATHNIEEIKKYIQGLIDESYAYITDTGVYFSVRKFKNYGKLSGQSIDQMLAGVKKDPDETKKDPLDFALWKKAKENEPSWPSDWGNGRPGWHIECSVMSTKYLKTDTLDIHAGGRDLIFPHHENEIAQSEAKTGKLFAKYWMHHGLLTINGQKMSKSLGNFVTVEDFLDKHKDADILKLFFLSAHYAHPIDYNDEKIEETKRMLERIKVSLRSMYKIYSKLENIPDVKVSPCSIDFIDDNKNKFLSSMDDDFNTPQALSYLFDLIKESNKVVDTAEDIDSYVTILNASNTIIGLLSIFGVQNVTYWDSLTPEENKLFEEYKEARSKKNYELSDKVRKILKEKNVIVEDTKEGSFWRKHLRGNL